jgi:hypothetical protein
MHVHADAISLDETQRHLSVTCIEQPCPSKPYVEAGMAHVRSGIVA